MIFNLEDLNIFNDLPSGKMERKNSGECRLTHSVANGGGTKQKERKRRMTKCQLRSLNLLDQIHYKVKPEDSGVLFPLYPILVYGNNVKGSEGVLTFHYAMLQETFPL